MRTLGWCLLLAVSGGYAQEIDRETAGQFAELQERARAIDGVDPERLSLDLYLPGPDHTPAAGALIVLYPHGGGWMAGSKMQSFLQPLVFVPAGFAFASANYRFRPEATVGRDHGQLNNLLGTDGDVPTAQIQDFVARRAVASDPAG